MSSQQKSALLLYTAFNAAATMLIITVKNRNFFVGATQRMGVSHLTKKHVKNVIQSAIADHSLT